MKFRTKQDEPHRNTDVLTSIKKNQMMKKKKKRLGGGGLSLEAFANAKSKSNDYNPALIKKQKEFYKNAKCVSKYKKTLKQQNQYSDPSWDIRPQEDNNETGDASTSTDKKKKKMSSYSLRKVYEKKHEEEENEKREREAAIQVRKEAIEKSQSLRKAKRQNMFKKTRSGQPVMKYRIEQLLESIQASTKK